MVGKRKKITHYKGSAKYWADIGYTACGLYRPSLASIEPNLLVTTIVPEFVTCKTCLRTKKFMAGER